MSSKDIRGRLAICDAFSGIVGELGKRAAIALTSAMTTQTQKGKVEYGTPLLSFNSRCAYADGISELADAAHYMTQLKEERDELLALCIKLDNAWHMEYRANPTPGSSGLREARLKLAEIERREREIRNARASERDE